MVHSATVWYDMSICRNNFENNESKWCILPLFDTICRHAEKKLKAMNLNGAFCHYLVRYLDLQNIWKQWIQMVHSAAIWYDISTCRTFESNESKWCILTRFETYARRVLGIRECYPIPPSPSLFIANLDVLFFSFLDMKSRPGPTGPIGATLVTTITCIDPWERGSLH